MAPSNQPSARAPAPISSTSSAWFLSSAACSSPKTRGLAARGTARRGGVAAAIRRGSVARWGVHSVRPRRSVGISRWAERVALPRHVLRRRPNRRDRPQESCASSAQRRGARPLSMLPRWSGAPWSDGAFSCCSSQLSPALSRSDWLLTLMLGQLVAVQQEALCPDTRLRQTGQPGHQSSTGCSRGT